MASILLLHGLFHVPGFLKAFGYSELPAIRADISRTAGLFWLVSFMLMSLSSLLLLGGNTYWWVLAFCGLLLSQSLILRFWSDARYGSIVNILVTIMVFSGYSGQVWQQKLNEERTALLHTAMDARGIQTEGRRDLPQVIRNWWQASGADRLPPPSAIVLEQEIRFRTEAGQTKWTEATAGHYMSISEPGFQWVMHADLLPLIRMEGRDLYLSQKGIMEIRINNFPLQKESGAKISNSSLQRYLAEFAWAPWAAGSHHMTWDIKDSLKVRAVIRDSEMETGGIFYFNEEGNFERFTALRFRSEVDEYQDWLVEAKSYDRFEGLTVPNELEISWVTPEETFTWMKLKVTKLRLLY